MDGKEIRFRQQSIPFHPFIFRTTAFSRCRIKYHPASERFRYLRHFPPDITHTDNAPRLSVQLGKRKVKIGKSGLCRIFPRLHVMVVMVQLFQNIKTESKRMLGNCRRGIIHHIRHFYPPAPAVLQIHIVVSRGKFTDQLHTSRILQCLPVQRGFVGNNNFRVPDPFPHFTGRRIGISRYFPQLPQTFHGDILPHAVPLQNHDFHSASPPVPVHIPLYVPYLLMSSATLQPNP